MNAPIDMAILPLEQVMILPTDVGLWEDELIWVKSRERDYPLDQAVPLVTFSPKCTYPEAAINCLNEHSIDYYVSMQSPSLSGVRDIVSSGMGVTLINRGLMTEDQCEWPEAKEFGVPIKVKFVVRTTGRIPQSLYSLVLEELKDFFPNKP